MQRDGGLAGAGTALDHEGAGDGGADDPVLLGLDGADDVRHPAGPLGVQGGQQRALALERIVVGEHVGVEDVILDGLDLAALQDQVAAAAHALPVERRGLVEVPGLGRAPVHHEPLQVLGGQADAADVLGLPGVQVKAAEHQPVVDGVELGQAVLVEGREGVPLGNVLHGAHGTGTAHLGQLGALFRPQLIQPGVKSGHIVAFMGQISVVHRTFPYRKRQTVHSTTISVNTAGHVSAGRLRRPTSCDAIPAAPAWRTARARSRERTRWPARAERPPSSPSSMTTPTPATWIPQRSNSRVGGAERAARGEDVVEDQHPAARGRSVVCSSRVAVPYSRA